jgi:hypothetical protein
MGRYQVQAPDGHTYEFEAPDDATPQQLDAMTREVSGYGKKYPVSAPKAEAPPPTAAPAPTEAHGMGQQLLDNTVNDLAGIAQGAAALPDMFASGAGKILSAIPNLIGEGLHAAGHEDAAKWIQENITHPLANPVQVGDLIEEASPTPDTPGGHANRFIGNLVGGAVTVPAAATEAITAKLVGEVPEIAALVKPAAKTASESVAKETAQAARDLEVDLPAFAVQGPKAAAQAVTRSKGGFGASDLGEAADTAIGQSRAARDKIASDLAPPRELDHALGEEISTAATEARTADRSRIGRMYDSGDEIMGATPVPLDQTQQAVNGLIAQDEAALAPSAALPILKQLQAKIGNGGPITASALRLSGQNLKTLMKQNQVDAGTADHIIGVVTDAMNGDMASAARGTDAAKVYADARSQWSASKQFDKTVLKPILGASFQNTGDQVARNIVTAAKTNGTRIAKLFAALPEETANSARSSLIMRLGAPANTAQNAAGDAFSLGHFLTNWNQLKGSRNLIFPKDTVQSLDKLAQIAQQGKSLEKVAANAAAAQSGGFRQALHSAPIGLGAAASYFTHDPKEIVLGMLATGLSGLKQYRAAKLLASTEFAKKLAATPLNAKGATAYWSRPWVDTLAKANPVIAGEIMAFRKGILAHANDEVVSSAAASPEADSEDQQQ